jgi:hypothetical protein
MMIYIYIYSITCVLSMKNLLQFYFIFLIFFMSSRILYKLKNLISVLHKDSACCVQEFYCKFIVAKGIV